MLAVVSFSAYVPCEAGVCYHVYAERQGAARVILGLLSTWCDSNPGNMIQGVYSLMQKVVYGSKHVNAKDLVDTHNYAVCLGN